MDYIQITKDLLSIDTTVPPGLNYEKIIDYLEPLFREAGCTTRKISIPPEHADGQQGRVNLIADRREPGKPRLIFYAHVDVVPAQGWEAFKPRLEEGKIYGRGAADMKGSITGLVLALENLKGQRLRFDTSVMITTDEETGQADQLRYLRQFLEPVSGAYFWSMDSSAGQVGIANLGAYQVDILVKGKSVHSALSHLGENAVEKANLLVQALMELKKKVVQTKSRVNTGAGTGLSKMEAKLNINVMQGGLKVNIVPDECLISVDRRLIPEEDLEAAKRELFDTLASVPGVRWETGKTFIIPPVPPCEDPLVDELAEIVREITGATGKFGEMGSGDLPNIAVNEWGGQEFCLGVGRTDCRIHGIDEYVYVKDIEDLGSIITRFIASP